MTFRNKYVDHPQQNKTYHWMTHGFGERCYIIYFLPKSLSVFYRDINEVDPCGPNFKPVVDCDEYFIPPLWERVQQAVVDVAVYILKKK